MLRALRVLLLLAVPASVALAQQVREEPPPYSGPMVRIPGVFVPPIAGAPFMATVAIESKHAAENGGEVTRRTQVLVARDSRGRIRNERHVLEPDRFKGTPPLVGVHVFDPTTRISYMLNPMTKVAREQQVPPAPERQRRPGGTGLGEQTLNGMQAHGSRITRVIPAAMSGTGNPVTITDEVWYSEELHINLLEVHTDPRSGTQTVAILSIKREEPDPQLFEVPAGYKIIDLSSPAAVR